MKFGTQALVTFNDGRFELRECELLLASEVEAGNVVGNSFIPAVDGKEFKVEFICRPPDTSAPRDDWYVNHDGDSRPIIHGPGMAMYSISQFYDGRWVPYQAENEHCKLFCEMANNELRPPKTGMKIIAADNFDRDSVSDELIAENVPIFYATKIMEYLNLLHGGDSSQQIFKVKMPDYTLYRFRP